MAFEIGVFSFFVNEQTSAKTATAAPGGLCKFARGAREEKMFPGAKPITSSLQQALRKLQKSSRFFCLLRGGIFFETGNSQLYYKDIFCH